MATYCYRTQDDQIIEKNFPIGQAPQVVGLEDGSEATRCLAAEIYSKTFPATGWPLECVASGVAPHQARELKEHLASKGVPTDVSADGNPIYRDKTHRKRALAARGMFDKDSFN